VTPIVIDLHEDPASLRLEAKREESRMAECFKQSYEAFDRGDRELAEKLSLRGKTHKANKERLNVAASTKIFQGTRLMGGACRIRQLTSSLI
jgi:hypothetical protein